MSLAIDVETGIADQDHRWLPTGRDGAWPDRRRDAAKWPAAPTNLSSVDQANGRKPAVIGLCLRSGQDSRMSETPDDSLKSP